MWVVDVRDTRDDGLSVNEDQAQDQPGLMCTWVRLFLVLLLTCYVTLGRILSLTEPQWLQV